MLLVVLSVMSDLWFHFFKHNRRVIQCIFSRSAVTGAIRLQAAFCAVLVGAIFRVGNFLTKFYSLRKIL